MKAAILSIGDELMLGQTADTNAIWLSGRLADVGVECVQRRTVSDDCAMQASAMRELADVADFVIVTGGLGPTDDDLTRAALQQAIGHGTGSLPPMLEDGVMLSRLERWFAERGRVMPAINRRQSLHPAGSEALPNEVGTAPGLRAKLGNATVVCLPGPPREMHPMYEQCVAPLLPVSPMKCGMVHAFGSGESSLAECLGDRMRRDRNPLVGTTASGSVVSARVRGRDQAASEAAIEKELSEIESLWKPFAFGRGSTTLAGSLGAALLQRKQTLAIAESCTGGLAGSLVTAESGSSTWFLGGLVTYANEVKRDMCDVPQTMLDQHGAVSEPVASALAQGVRKKLKADWAASITGIAGPTGGSDDKPVGTVWIGVCGPQFEAVRRFRFPGDRATVRDRAAKTAIALLRMAITDPSNRVSLLWEWPVDG